MASLSASSNSEQTDKQARVITVRVPVDVFKIPVLQPRKGMLDRTGPRFVYPDMNDDHHIATIILGMSDQPFVKSLRNEAGIRQFFSRKST